MDLNNVTLEITTLIIAFDHYDTLVARSLGEGLGSNDEYKKILSKNREHIKDLFNDAVFYDQGKELIPLPQIKDAIMNDLKGSRSKDIHELIEKLEKDAKKIKKLYRALQG